ncbi:MAG: hypothetical protein V1827_01055 [Candidatus Micrarchaeota archaeon]
MTRYVFSDISLEWLKENGFDEEEVDALQDILNKIESKRIGGPHIPKDATPNVSALATLLEAITDAEGRPICFEESGLIGIPHEAREYFEEDLQLDELERVSTRLKKVKFARRYSDPRRRGTMKANDKFGLI